MNNYIKVFNSNNNTRWENNLSDEDFKQVEGYCKSRNSVPIIPAIFKPVRTNNLKNFAKDFFLPTTINRAIKVQNTVGRIFAILFSLVLDTITFPIRLLTCIPRVISNSKQGEHPLFKYLKDQKVDKKLLESDHVLVELAWETTDEHNFTQIGNTKTYNPVRRSVTENVNFIETPIHSHSYYYGPGRRLPGNSSPNIDTPDKGLPVNQPPNIADID